MGHFVFHIITISKTVGENAYERKCNGVLVERMLLDRESYAYLVLNQNSVL